MFLFFIILITSATGLTTLYFEAKLIINRRNLNCRSVGHHVNINLAFAEIIAVKMLHPICQKIWKTQQWPQDWKRSVSFHSKKGQCQKLFKLLYNCTQISNTSKVMLKILQLRLQQYVNREHPDVQAGFRKSIGTRDQIVNIC